MIEKEKRLVEKMKTKLEIMISTLFILIFFNSLLLAAESCGKIHKIYKLSVSKKEPINSSTFLKIYRNEIPIDAKVGMDIYANDKIQADKASIEFDIIWNPDDKIPSVSHFSSSENTPVHIILEKCSDEIAFYLVGDMISIIKSDRIKKLFKVKTKTAIAGIRGTTFRIQQLEYGNILKLLVLNGQVVLSNRKDEILISKNEEGISKIDKFLIKDKKSIEYIHKEVNYLIKQHKLSPIFINEFNKFTIRQNSLDKNSSIALQKNKIAAISKKSITIDLKKQETWVQEMKAKFEKQFEKQFENKSLEFQEHPQKELEVYHQKFQDYLQKGLEKYQQNFQKYQQKELEANCQKFQKHQQSTMKDNQQGSLYNSQKIIQDYQQKSLDNSQQIFQDYQRESLYNSQKIYQEYQQENLYNSQKIIQNYQKQFQNYQQNNYQQFQKQFQNYQQNNHQNQ